MHFRMQLIRSMVFTPTVVDRDQLSISRDDDKPPPMWETERMRIFLHENLLAVKC